MRRTEGSRAVRLCPDRDRPFRLRLCPDRSGSAVGGGPSQRYQGNQEQQDCALLAGPLSGGTPSGEFLGSKDPGGNLSTQGVVFCMGGSSPPRDAGRAPRKTLMLRGLHPYPPPPEW